MITVRQVLEILQKCKPDALVRIAIPGNDYSDNVSFIEQCDELEVHFCDSIPDERPTLDDYLNDEK